ncbi:Dicer-like protein 1 [Leucoagaricus sp. SymC.cos]|nr:Dicer-like protein 1 [Leucoagaricus sp. SymC.cos]
MLRGNFPPTPGARPRILILVPKSCCGSSQVSDLHELEVVLDAALLGIGLQAPDADEVSAYKSRRTELVITYHRHDNLQETLLCKRLQDCDPQGSFLGRHIRHAKFALHELGPCAADLVWREAFGPSIQNPGSTSDGLERQSSLVRARELVKHWPFKLPNLDMTSRNMNVSHKFIRLVQVLESYQFYGDNFRGIIFVQRRIIAQLLEALFHSLVPRLQFLRPLVAMNHRNSSELAWVENVCRQFTSGKCNLLIATKSYEDIPFTEASIVISFDVFESQMSRVYARSRIRDMTGHLVHMIEEGNNVHRHALSRSSLDAEMLRWGDTMQHGCPRLIPPRPLRESRDAFISDSEDDQDIDLVHDPVTGDRLGKHQAVTSLYSFAARLDLASPQTQNRNLLDYEESDTTGRKEWRCIIRMPTLPNGMFYGPYQPLKYLARREACYSAFCQLQHLSEVDCSTFPHHRVTGDQVQDDDAEIQIEPGHERPHVPLSPDFWKISISHPLFAGFLYPWIVSTTTPGSGLDERAPICILTRAPLPDLPHFELFHFNKSVQLSFNRAPPVKLDPDQLHQAHQFTIKFCRIVMNKSFESSTWQEMGYLFLPFKKNWGRPSETDWLSSPSIFVNSVDWHVVSLVSKNWAVPLMDLNNLGLELEDAVVQDRAVEFTHRCEISRIRNDLTPLSVVDDKPLVLIPEYCHKLTVPASTLRMGYLLPSITRRIDELLLVKQLNARILDHCVHDDLLVIATASPLAGNDYDYERLELLGDAFLKYLSSTYVYAQNPQGSEGELHTARQKYISNQHLCHLASRLGLPGYIQVKPFSVKSWVPPGMRLGDPQQKQTTPPEPNEPAGTLATPPNPIADKPSEQSLMDSNPGKQPKTRKRRLKKSTPLSPIANKTVADVVEAIMGAAYISGGRDAALKAAKFLTIPFTEIEEWSDLDRSDCVPLNTGHRLDASAIIAIESIIGHAFMKQHLLSLAMVHTTFNTVEMKNHQRLEFIGDAVLDFMVVRYLYDKKPHASPGDLSVSKSMMVSNSTLAAVCVWSGLHRFIHTTQQLGQTIQNYEKALRSQQAAVFSGAHSEGSSLVQYWKDLEAPKALSDVVESVIGAALISDGFSQSGVDIIFQTLLLPFYEKYIP